MEINLCVQALWILFLPLAAFVIQIFFGKKLPPRHRQGDYVPTLAMFACLCMAAKMFFEHVLFGAGLEKAQEWYPLENWLSVGGGAFSMKFGILVDNLTIVMLFVVTLVSFLVHLYSMGYMHGEARYNRFFAFLALFSFSMLGLCITSNLLFLFIFWELVGLCSYFLIGFYFERKSAQAASVKAFITTRIGDLGFFLAILMIAGVAESLEFKDIFQSVADNKWQAVMGGAGLTIAAVCLFFGPIGKSAQFPLHVWLPDAMEGPTPVSALIHAATMVAAGVYLVGRMFPFMAGTAYFEGDFFHSPALTFVAVIGGFTAIFAASIAFAQTDIKKVLAYSTVSQLGYMMLGLGVGSVAFGLFHLTTHAMFKALLFLGSGSVIHAVHSNELADMGGLRKKLPITWATMLIGTLAIAGLPFLSGFYSKEGILTQALAVATAHDNIGYWFAFVCGMATAFMTSFYMFRMFIKTFHGHPRNHHAYEHAHESPWTMTVPLVVLAVLSIGIGGYPGQHESWAQRKIDSTVLAPIAVPAANLPVNEADRGEYASEALAHVGHAFHSPGVHYGVLGLSLAAFAIGLAGAWYCFGRKEVESKAYGAAGSPLAPLRRALENLWYLDALYTKLLLGALHGCRHACDVFDKVVVDGLVNLQAHVARFLAWVVGNVDYDGVDGAVRGLGSGTLKAGRWFRKLQTGNLQQYIYASVFLAVGVLVVSVGLIFWLTK
jgi:NADH-quinone oxidoreductase subunit L